MKEQVIPMEKITGNTNRQYGGEGEIRILAEDMKANGLINPVTVMLPRGVPKDSDELVIVAGRRRYAAAKLLGWAEIRANVLDESEADKAEAIAGSENINRMDMHPLDEAAVFKKLIEMGETAEGLAKRFDRTWSAIWQRVQLLDLGDGVKQLFRDGKLSLLSAAMLKGLNAKQQEAFCALVKKNYAKGSVPDYEAKSFVAKAQADKMYYCLRHAGCERCEKRTFYSHKTLFPELGGMEDSCLDHDCYMKQWRGLLSWQIKNCCMAYPGFAEADVIYAGSELKKILGASVALDSGEYTVKALSAGLSAGTMSSVKEKGNEGVPCFKAILDGRKFEVHPVFWKEDAKKKAKPAQKEKSAFAPMVKLVKLLDIPKEEAERMTADLAARYGPKESWMVDQKADEISWKTREKVFNRLLESKAKQKDDGREIDRFLAGWLDCNNNKGVAKLFAGSADVKALRKLSWPRLFALLNAAEFDYWELPEVAEIAAAKAKKNEAAEWAGVPMAELKTMYREELQALLPKPEAQERARAQAKAVRKKAGGVRTCRVCGCTDGTPCIGGIGGTCHWIEKDLCSACSPDQKMLDRFVKSRKSAAKKAVKKAAAEKSASKKQAKKKAAPAAKKKPGKPKAKAVADKVNPLKKK